MKELTHVSLFSGIGGLDIAAELAGFTTVGQCEMADYPTAVLEKHWPNVPKWRDIRTLNGSDFYERTHRRTADVISGGFPCQPFSVAGKKRGMSDDRYLWPEMLRVIDDIRPSWIVGENVANIVNMALDTVCTDLENIGYTVQPFIIPAAGVNAPHLRNRCAIVANSNGERLPELDFAEIPTGPRHISGSDDQSHMADDDAKQPQGTRPELQTKGAAGRSNKESDVSDSSNLQIGGGAGARMKLKEMQEQGQISEEEYRSFGAGNGGQLNPEWVEWLMGFPIGWTSLD